MSDSITSKEDKVKNRSSEQIMVLIGIFKVLYQRILEEQKIIDFWQQIYLRNLFF